jgi:hypothetical protein
MTDPTHTIDLPDHGLPPWKWTLSDDGEPVPSTDLLAWAAWYEANHATRCQLRKTDVDGLRVSTVFLAVGFHEPDGTPPHLFETKIFDDLHRDIDHTTWKAPTLEAALECHESAVTLARLWLAGTPEVLTLVSVIKGNLD